MVTLKDIAREAGVSKALVSYYLSGSKAGRMSRETAERIGDAVKKLNYRPNRLARSLRTGKSRNIGFLVGNISDFYFGHLTEEVLEAARRLDYSPIIAVTKHSPKEKGEALVFLMRNRIDGLLIAVSIADVPQRELLAENGIPVLRFTYPEPDAVSLLCDISAALLEACRCFKERGHTSMFGYFDRMLPWNRLLDIAAEQAGIELVHKTYYSAEERGEILRYIEEERPSAILLNGMTLYDVLNRLETIPGYFPELIIGVDEFRILRESPQIIGAIRTCTAEKARRGVRLLVDRLEQPALPREEVIYLPPAEFVRYC